MPDDRYKYFRVEAREILDQLGRRALDLDKGTSVPETVAGILRLAHTLKGAARVVKQQAIAERAHALEGVLAPFRDAEAVPRERIDQVLALVDDIGRGVATIPGASAPAAEQVTIDQAAPLPSFRPAVADLDALLRSVLEARMRLNGLEWTLAQAARARQLAAAVAEQAARPENRAASRNGASALTAKLAAFADELRGVVRSVETGLASSVDQLDRELKQVRDSAERLRLAPVGGLFTFLERALRDAAAALGKRVVFEASGA